MTRAVDSRRFGSPEGTDQAVRRDARGRPGVADDRAGQHGGAARAFGLRQDHDVAHDRRAGRAERRRDLPRRAVDHPGAGASPQYRHAVPELRAVSAHDRRREHRLRAGDARHQARRRRRTRRRRVAAGAACRNTATACRGSCRAGSSSASHWPARWSSNRRCCCWTSRSGALDKALRQSMQVELRALQQRLGMTTVMVTHDQDEALTMADRIVIMRDGRIEQVGAPAEVYQRPVSRFVAGFLGASNFLRGRVVDAAERRDTGRCAAGPDGIGRVVAAGRQRSHGSAQAGGHRRSRRTTRANGENRRLT